MYNCRKCGIEFTPTEHKIKKSDFICSDCSREYAKEYNKKRKALGIKISGSVMSREYYNAYAKKYYSNEKNRKRRAEYMKARRRDEKERYKSLAREATRRALKKGLISKTVCKCGCDKVEAHHHDYSKPLDVIWLCRRCHGKLHKKLKDEAKRAKGE